MVLASEAGCASPPGDGTEMFTFATKRQHKQRKVSPSDINTVAKQMRGSRHGLRLRTSMGGPKRGTPLTAEGANIGRPITMSTYPPRQPQISRYLTRNMHKHPRLSMTEGRLKQRNSKKDRRGKTSKHKYSPCASTPGARGMTYVLAFSWLSWNLLMSSASISISATRSLSTSSPLYVPDYARLSAKETPAGKQAGGQAGGHGRTSKRVMRRVHDHVMVAGNSKFSVSQRKPVSSEFSPYLVSVNFDTPQPIIKMSLPTNRTDSHSSGSTCSAQRAFQRIGWSMDTIAVAVPGGPRESSRRPHSCRRNIHTSIIMTNFPPLLLARPLVWIKLRLVWILSMETTRLHSGTSIPSEHASVVTRTCARANPG